MPGNDEGEFCEDLSGVAAFPFRQFRPQSMRYQDNWGFKVIGFRGCLFGEELYCAKYTKLTVPRRVLLHFPRGGIVLGNV